MQISQSLFIVAVMAASSIAFPGHLGEEGHHVDYYAHPKYKFGYGVKDHHTGDNKDQWEERDGDVVKGAYSLHEPDGTILRVEYTADKHNGFNAVVKRLGKAIHPEPVHHFGGGGDGGQFSGGEGGHHGDASSFSNGNNIAIAHHGGHY